MNSTHASNNWTDGVAVCLRLCGLCLQVEAEDVDGNGGNYFDCKHDGLAYIFFHNYSVALGVRGWGGGGSA